VVKTLADAPLPQGGTWNRNGVIVFGATIAQPLFRIPAAGGQALPVTRVPELRSAQTSSWPYFLPDGQHFLYSVQWTVPAEGSGTGLYAGSLDSKGDRLVSSEIAGNVALSSGHLLFVREGRILAQPFDPVRLRTTAPPVSITEQEIERDTITLLSGFSASQAGGLVFGSAADFASHLTWFDSSGHELGTVPQSGYRSPSLSPDGRTVVVACDEAHKGRYSICVYDLERGVSTKITDGSNDASPIWSRDGREITYESRDKDIA
jgi:eukaryotic-like serine/threonine-protein kinase